MFRGKKYQNSAKQIDRATLYESKDAFEIICKTASAKFDETVELHVKLGVDSRHADQQVRGAIVLPHGTGKTARVLVFAKGDKADAARAAGADYVGDMDMVEKIQKENWFDFDVVVASPDMMGVVGRLGKVLGPKGLMPSPKAGTVTLGVRPEHMMLCGDDSELHVTGTVDVSEMMGSSIHLHSNVHGKDVVLVVSTVDLPEKHRQGFTYGETVKIAFSGDVMHVFDTSTGMALT